MTELPRSHHSLQWSELKSIFHIATPSTLLVPLTAGRSLLARRCTEPYAEFGDAWPDRSPLALSPLQARAIHSGAEVWMLSISQDCQTIDHAIAVRQVGRLRTGLSITLLGAAPRGSEFWDAAERFGRRVGATTLQLESIGLEPESIIPQVPNETNRFTAERLYFVDLRIDDIESRFGTIPRKNGAMAAKRGVSLLALDDTSAALAHEQLTAQSLARRAEKGQDVTSRSSVAFIKASLQTGQGRFFQAGVAGEVMSSNFVYAVGRHVFYYSSGTSVSGMKIGASHFLMSMMIRTLKADGFESFNMDIAGADNVGLMRFKEGFGPTVFFVERVTANRESAWRMLRNIARWR